MTETAAQATDRSIGLLCPLCSVNLLMSERQGIEIDYCPKCRGVWLDRGELDKIIERTLADEPRSGRAQSGPDQRTAPPPPPSQPGYHDNDRHGHKSHSRHDDNHHGHGYRGGRHGSFLSRLFD
ncbi:MAG: recombination protein RecR [Shinella sp.]|nr:MAG: recombination protein RecR [Shinella sp.]